MGNNPVSHIDPLGLETGGTGFNFDAGFGGGGSFNISVVWDSSNQIGVSITVGGGGYGPYGTSGAVQSQVTNAQNIQQLGGAGGSTSVTFGEGPIIGGGSIFGSGYQGVTVTTGFGYSPDTPVTFSGQGTYTWVWCLINCGDGPGGGRLCFASKFSRRHGGIVVSSLRDVVHGS